MPPKRDIVTIKSVSLPCILPGDRSVGLKGTGIPLNDGVCGLVTVRGTDSKLRTRRFLVGSSIVVAASACLFATLANHSSHYQLVSDPVFPVDFFHERQGEERQKLSSQAQAFRERRHHQGDQRSQRHQWYDIRLFFVSELSPAIAKRGTASLVLSCDRLAALGPSPLPCDLNEYSFYSQCVCSISIVVVLRGKRPF